MSNRSIDRVRDRHRDRDHHRHRRSDFRDPNPKRRRSSLAVEPSGDEERRQLRASDRNPSKTLIPPEQNSSLPKSSNVNSEGHFERRRGVSTTQRGDCEIERKIEDPSQIPRSLSYFQHDERSEAAQIGRSFGRRTVQDHQWKEKRDDSMWRHDGYFEQQEELAHVVRKRPAFREKKDDVTGETLEGQRGNYSYRVREISKGQNGHKGQGFRGERRDVRRGSFSERDGYNGRKEKVVEFKAGGDKWKHDLFEESNKSYSARNEEEQIAKIEELLTS